MGQVKRLAPRLVVTSRRVEISVGDFRASRSRDDRHERHEHRHDQTRGHVMIGKLPCIRVDHRNLSQNRGGNVVLESFPVESLERRVRLNIVEKHLDMLSAWNLKSQHIFWGETKERASPWRRS